MSDLVERLRSYADDADEHGGVPRGSGLVPIHKTTLREVVTALSRADELAEAVEAMRGMTRLQAAFYLVPYEMYEKVKADAAAYRSARGERR